MTTQAAQLETALLDSLQRFHEEQPDELGPDHVHGPHVGWRTDDLPAFLARLAAALADVAV